MHRLLQNTFASMLNDGDDLITELEGRFIDASLYRDRMPNTFITVPDIVLQSCRRITSPEQHFDNLDSNRNTKEERFKSDRMNVRWDYQGKYMY